MKKITLILLSLLSPAVVDASTLRVDYELNDARGAKVGHIVINDDGQLVEGENGVRVPLMYTVNTVSKLTFDQMNESGDIPQTAEAFCNKKICSYGVRKEAFVGVRLGAKASTVDGQTVIEFSLSDVALQKLEKRLDGGLLAIDLPTFSQSTVSNAIQIAAGQVRGGSRVLPGLGQYRSLKVTVSRPDGID